MANSTFFGSKYGDFGPFFQQKIFAEVAAPFSWFPTMKFHWLKLPKYNNL
jgi:hypothetical protein